MGDLISTDEDTPVPSFESLLTSSIRYALRSVLYFSNDTADAVCLFMKFDNDQQVRVMPLFRYGKDLLSINEASAIVNIGTDEADEWVNGFLANYVTGELMTLFRSNRKAIPESIWCFYDLTEERVSNSDAQHMYLTYRATSCVPNSPSLAPPPPGNMHGDIDLEVSQWVYRTMKATIGATSAPRAKSYSN